MVGIAQGNSGHKLSLVGGKPLLEGRSKAHPLGGGQPAGTHPLVPGGQQDIFNGGGHGLHSAVPVGIIRLQQKDQHTHGGAPQGGQELVRNPHLFRVAGKALFQHRGELLHHAPHDLPHLFQGVRVLHGHKVPVL